MNRDDVLFLAFVLMTVGAVIDVITTMYAIDMVGYHVEQNPFARALMETFGIWVLPLFKAVFLFILMSMALHIRKTQPLEWYAIGGLYLVGICWIALGINNLHQIILYV